MAMMIVTWTEDVTEGEDGDGWVNRKAVSFMRLGDGKVRMVVGVNGEELAVDMGGEVLAMVQGNMSHMRWGDSDAVNV